VPRPLNIVLILAALCASTLAKSDQVLQLDVEKASASSWQIEGLEFEFRAGEAGLGASARIAELSLPQSGTRLHDISITCARLELSTQSIACASAHFDTSLPAIGRQSTAGTFRINTATGAASITLREITLAGGSARIEATTDGTALTLGFETTPLQIQELLELGTQLGIDTSAWSAAGSVALSGQFADVPGGEENLELSAQFSNMALGNAAGTIASDNLHGQLQIGLAALNGAVQFDLQVDSDSGEAYLEPVYANLSENALHLRAEQVRSDDFRRFHVPRFELQQDTLLDLQGSADIVLPADENSSASLSGTMRLADTSVATVYSSLLQVALAGTILGDLETDGRVAGSIEVKNNSLQSARLQLSDLVLDDRNGRFAVYGLGGVLDWPGTSGRTAAPSQLRWDSALVYNIAIAAVSADFRLGDNDIELLSPLRLPTMGGALLLRQLQLKDYGTAAASGVLDAELEPIRIGQLAGAFGWPAFSGTLSGRLPSLQLANETATIGGALNARAFDGDIEVSGLRIEQPFGRVPRLYADVRLRNLDLQRLTDAFSFGLIQGRLSGDVTGLQLENWQTVAMDMHFYTPEGDRSQRRISQRAVENLASVGGGGATAILSSGLLQFFEVFAYERIGLRCVLRDGICAMSGAGPSKNGPFGQGFYIVKGSGLPRIDVVGFRNQVSWAGLVQQLAAITSSGTPTLN